MTLTRLRYRLVTAIRTILGLSRERRWNRAYQQGSWDWLGRIDELAHYSVIAGYVLYVKPGARVLDVGCGDGLLAERLDPRACVDYLGFDFEEPVRRALNAVRPRARFLVADLNVFETGERFDAIVFNESLYYAADPAELLGRYGQMLTPGGVFVISMHTAPRNESRWQAVDERCTILDATTITNTAGTRWIVKCVAPAPVASG
jgi:SAM-dependent methyltransferase